MRIPVHSEAERCSRELELPFNEYGVDPYGISRDNVAQGMTFLRFFYRNYFKVLVHGMVERPMMFTLGRNNYEYQLGFDQVVYLVSSVPVLIDQGCSWIASDRNAALSLAQFVDDERELVEHISWDVIRAKYWNDYDDGCDLRAAEFLVHDSVPWEAIELIGTRTAPTRTEVKRLIAGQRHRPEVSVRPDWYF